MIGSDAFGIGGDADHRAALLDGHRSRVRPFSGLPEIAISGMRVDDQDVAARGKMNCIYLPRLDASLAVGLDNVATEAADNFQFGVIYDVYNILQPRDACRFFHPQSHRILRHAHHRFRHVHRGLPLIALHHFLAGYSGKHDLRAARHSLDPVRKDGADTHDKIKIEDLLVGGDARAILRSAKIVEALVIFVLMLVDLVFPVKLPELFLQFLRLHGAMGTDALDKFDLIVFDARGVQLFEDAG